MVCDKITYTKAEVQDIVKGMSSHGKPVRSYMCRECGGFHVTSKESKRRVHQGNKSVEIKGKVKTGKIHDKKPRKHSKIHNVPATYTLKINL